MLVIAIFIITVLMLLGLAMTKVLNNASNSVSIEVLGTRAFLAAQSGADVGLAALFPVSGGQGICSNTDTLAKLPDATGFKTCNVKFKCNAVDVIEQGNKMTQYTISSSATCGQANCSDGQTCLRVNRQVQVKARSNG